MADLKEKQTCIKFFFKLGKNAMQTSEVLKIASGEQAMEKCKFSSGLPSSKSSGTSTQGATT
jgi:hypothetical protein